MQFLVALASVADIIALISGTVMIAIGGREVSKDRKAKQKLLKISRSSDLVKKSVAKKLGDGKLELAELQELRNELVQQVIEANLADHHRKRILKMLASLTIEGRNRRLISEVAYEVADEVEELPEASTFR